VSKDELFIVILHVVMCVMQLALRYHPDKNDSPEATEKVLLLTFTLQVDSYAFTNSSGWRASFFQVVCPFIPLSVHCSLIPIPRDALSYQSVEEFE